MKQSLRKFISSLLTISTTLGLTGLGLASTAYAGQLTEAKVTMTVVTQGANSQHAVYFKAASVTPIKTVVIQYRQAASGSSTIPDSFTSTSASMVQVLSKNVSDTSNWSLNASVNGDLTYTATSAINGITAGSIFEFTASGITNNAIGGGNPCDAVTDSDTCFVRITTKDNGGAVIDTTTTTYTVINNVTVTATVDPILTFTVTGVGSGTTNEAGQGGATSVTSTSTTIPFGNVTVGTAKVAQQSLAVLTNANNGYNVYAKFSGSEVMTGTYSGNNVDAFTASSATWSSDDAGAGGQTFVAPTGTAANVNSAWLGMRTNNANVSGFAGANTFAPPYVGANTGKRVMISATPDNGTTPTYVTFKIQANAYQPSDSYTGTLVYNVVASY